MKSILIKIKHIGFNKTILCSLFLCSYTSLLFSQSNQYFILVNTSKQASWCEVDTGFTTFMLSGKLDTDKRDKIIEVYKNRLNASENRKIKKVEYYVGNSDFILVYEYIISNEDCPDKTQKYIKSIKASSKEKAYQLLQKRLETSFTKNRYISHKILFETQAFIDQDANLLQEAEQFLRENTKKDSLKKTKRATAVGIRG